MQSISQNLTFESEFRGKRVLFINAIRLDTPSGGNTSTQAMLARLRELCRVVVLPLNPSKSAIDKVGFLFATLPAAFFVLWSRFSGHVWLEFLLRASPWLYLRCLWARWRIQPEVVVFNHHASFLYLSAFLGCRCVLVWHDLPSLKRDAVRKINSGARVCAALESMALSYTQFNLSFSFEDDKVLRRLHGQRSMVMPVIDKTARPRHNVKHSGRWLLLGNWTRAENCEGAKTFLILYAELSGQFKHHAKLDPTFHVAGYGSDIFVNDLRAQYPELQALQLLTTSHYKDIRDFEESALLAPLLRGAGIKLKTIEAWSVGIPVVGTAQAFSGLPANIWRRGGLRVSSIKDMVLMCLIPTAYEKAASSLDPIAAYKAYCAAIQSSAETLKTS